MTAWIVLALAAGDWRSLFEKEGFAHWKSPSGKTAMEGAWTNRKGVFTVRPYVHRRTDLWTEEEYGDFELEWEWMAEKGANSGVKYWVQNSSTLVVEVENEKWRRIPDPEQAKAEEVTLEYSRGLEYQMADDEHEPDSLRRPDSRSGGLYSLFPPSPEKARPHGQWNKSRLIVLEGKFEHWLNGVRVAAFDDGQLTGQIEAKRPGYRIEKASGPIALQYHQTVVSFRKMRIRRLD